MYKITIICAALAFPVVPANADFESTLWLHSDKLRDVCDDLAKLGRVTLHNEIPDGCTNEKVRLSELKRIIIPAVDFNLRSYVGEIIRNGRQLFVLLHTEEIEKTL